MEALKMLRNINQVHDMLWKMFYTRSSSKITAKNVKVLILCTPCNGFGDIVFAMKISQYLKRWYGCSVKIGTTHPSGFLQLGAPKADVITLGKGQSIQCRRFRNLTGKVPKADLVFVAPVMSDYDVSFADVKGLVPYSTKLNTFFFSEYNDSLDKNFDFNTGIGKGRCGLLLTDGKGSGSLNIKKPYAMLYIAEGISGAQACWLSFVEMVSAKYSKTYKKFQIVIPKWVADSFPDKLIIKKIGKYFGTIRLDDELILEGDCRDRELLFRSDILAVPVPNHTMKLLMKNSVDDILLTGDQSITDALSCCSKKNIFYQIADWKYDLGKELAKQLPNKYLSRTKTSCGTLAAIKYKSNYTSFVKNNDFRKLAKPKMDAIMMVAKKLKTDKTLQKMESILLASKSLTVIKTKMEKLLN